MRFFRSERVSSLIEKELSRLLIKELDIPDALVTITGAEVQKKMDRAHVRVSVLPSEKAPEVMHELGRRAGELQFKLHRLLNIKPMPRLVFELDRGPERAANLEKVLLEEDNKGDLAG